MAKADKYMDYVITGRICDMTNSTVTINAYLLQQCFICIEESNA